MDFLKKLLTIFIISTTLSYADTGIVLVHGTNNHTQDADGEYWKPDYISNLASSLQNPKNIFVAHCDFSKYMWSTEAVGCVAEQTNDFIKSKNLDDVIFITHSDGGNVIRYLLSNPTYNLNTLEVSNKTKEVIAIAPSSGGTPLADEVINGSSFESGVGWLLGYKTDAVKQQRVGDMAIFNHDIIYATQHMPNLAVPFRVIVGTSVTASPLNQLSYCNGYWLNTALKITKAYLPDCADGFLTCKSQTAAGDLWFYDIEKTENFVPLSHNQTRHSCAGLGDILISEIKHIITNKDISA